MESLVEAGQVTYFIMIRENPLRTGGPESHLQYRAILLARASRPFAARLGKNRCPVYYVPRLWDPAVSPLTF
jgi:hypothetical protein